ncbi:hypothetical protein [Cohnella rhizosphaerae]|uniref:Uncharacterized protein n=1 Tax=Cohnella rhizosphaerae TaxID=1457232 RepID=A0A9X4QT22_9BACL|nr:hypothetical protein [Cohnella rhizosphaerae]MDG0809893.1 hypothetical protein [Cohnella rhizosphaerae]
MEAISGRLSENEAELKRRLHPGSDIVIRTFAHKNRPLLMLVYLDGMAGTDGIEQLLLRPLLYAGLPDGLDRLPSLAETLRRGCRSRT